MTVVPSPGALTISTDPSSVASRSLIEVMDRLAEFYLGPGKRYPLRDAPEGVVIHVSVERIYGQGI